MAEFGFFDREVAGVVGVGGDFDGELLDDFDAVDFEAVHFLGVVGEDAELAQAKVADDLRPYAVVSTVYRQA